MARRPGVLVVLVTCPTPSSARRMARVLLSKRLVACVNIVPGVDSWFWWKGKIDHSREVLLVLKTVVDKFESVRRSILAHHPYQVPEVLAVASSNGHGPYLEWVRSSVQQSR